MRAPPTGIIEAIIFDLDGTIIDSEVFNMAAINATLDEFEQAPIELPESAYRGVRWSVIADRVRAERPDLGEAKLAPVLHRHFQRLVDQHAEPIPGVVDFIRRMSGRLPLAIGTSSPHESADHAVQRLDLGEHFRVIVAAEDYGPSKPAPDCFLLAARNLGVSPGGCLVFEDSPAGLEAARSAGMHVVAISHGRTSEEAEALRADVTLDDFTAWSDELFKRFT